MRTVSQKDGIHFDLSQRFVADGRNADGDVHIVSHAHTDHMLRGSAETVVCSEATATLAQERGGPDVDTVEEHDNVELLPSGHIVGSRAALIDDGEHSYLYTGDVSTRDRCYLDGFDPVSADTLIVESTYGIPAYRFPPHEEVAAAVQDFVTDTDAPLFLFGYSLGRAQKLQHIVQDATNRPIFVHEKVRAMHNAVADVADLTFDAEPYSERRAALPDDAIVLLPSHTSRKDWAQDVVDKVGGVKAGFSGWAVKDSYRYRGNYDVTFPLSDHCDFDELEELVEAVDPEEVYTHHGFDEAFAAHLRAEKGYNAKPLKEGQTSITDF